MKRELFFTLLVIALAGAYGAGFYTASVRPAEIIGAPSAFISATETPEEVRATGADFSLFWDVWKKIDEFYIKPEEKNPEERVWGAIQGLVASLDDPYSVFFPPEEAEFFASEIRGNFTGVGMEIEFRDQILTVVTPLRGTPAERAGIKPGDRIFKIDGTSTHDLSITQAVTLIRGERGTTVNLSIARDGVAELMEISVVRDIITIPTVETEIRDGVFIIRLLNFSEGAPPLFRDALREFVYSGTNKLILDLRNNPGGFLEAAVEIAGWFLPVGTLVTEENFGDKDKSIYYRSRGPGIFPDDFRFVILVNKGSASASEILAAALSEHGKATTVGEQTFGKGTVQQLFTITPETSLKLTVAQWLTPNGNEITEKGITPDIVVAGETPGGTVSSGNAEDIQLKRAIEIALGKP